MSLMRNANKLMILAALVLAVASAQAFTANYASQANLVYTSTDSITNADFSTVSPNVPLTFQPFVQVGGVLGYYGPLGPFGPLSTLGPLGSNLWSVSNMISGISWNSYSQFLTLNGGPLSQSGPLGNTGPLNPDIYMGLIQPGLSLFSSGAYAQHLRGLGLWSALGPIGPLGALGPLGPLGTIGAHGYQADSNGNFLDSNGNVVRQVSVNYDGTNDRTYNLFETYTDDYAKANPSLLDTSFMITGGIENMNTIADSKFTFTSADNQIVTIVVVPEKSLDQFALGLYDSNGRLIGTSTTEDLVQTIQIQVLAGQSFVVGVELTSSLQLLSKTYRLIVTGSSQYLNMNNVSGNHILPYYESAVTTSNFRRLIRTTKFLSK